MAGNNNKKKTKTHPELDLMTTLCSAVEKVALERAEAKSKEFQVWSKELEAANKKAEADTKLKERELAAIEKKIDVETKKSRGELSKLYVQQKEQLLLARKRLLDTGVPVSEVDLMLPLH